MIGKALYDDPRTKKEGNPYWEWIESYAGEEYQNVVKAGRGKWEPALIHFLRP